MSIAGTGDRLAAGQKSAAFGGAGSAITDYEQDFTFMGMDEVCKKYGLNQAEYDTDAAWRLSGEKLPDRKPVGQEKELFTIKDLRRNYFSEPVAEQPKKYSEPTYEPVQTLMDRVLAMVISDDPNIELLEDGSTRDKRTGLIQTAKYRQHSNVGIVLLAGQWVVMGGIKTPMSEIVSPGDKIVFGDYGSEKFNLSDEKAEALCDKLGVNYEKTEQGMRIIRVQDIRTVEHRAVPNEG